MTSDNNDVLGCNWSYKYARHVWDKDTSTEQTYNLHSPTYTSSNSSLTLIGWIMFYAIENNDKCIQMPFYIIASSCGVAWQLRTIYSSNNELYIRDCRCLDLD